MALSKKNEGETHMVFLKTYIANILKEEVIAVQEMKENNTYPIPHFYPFLFIWLLPPANTHIAKQRIHLYVGKKNHLYMHDTV